MKILVADDHELVRDMIVAYLETAGDFDVTSVKDMFKAETAILEEGPFDLVLLDYDMPGMDGLSGLDRAIAANGGQPVGIISGIARRAEAEAALGKGAAGFLPKDMPAKSLVNAIRFMASGEQYAPIQFMTQSEEVPENALAKKLTKRENEVLGGLCRGMSNKEIARELSLEEATIKLHVRTLCRKLDARNRTHAAMIAREANFA